MPCELDEGGTLVRLPAGPPGAQLRRADSERRARAAGGGRTSPFRVRAGQPADARADRPGASMHPQGGFKARPGRGDGAGRGGSLQMSDAGIGLAGGPVPLSPGTCPTGCGRAMIAADPMRGPNPATLGRQRAPASNQHAGFNLPRAPVLSKSRTINALAYARTPACRSVVTTTTTTRS